MLKRYLLLLVALSLLFGLLLLTNAGPAQDPPEEDALFVEDPPAELAQYTEFVNTGQFKRAWWAYSRRAAGLGYIPEGARQRAFRQKGAHPPAVGHWENIGPAPSLGFQVRGAFAADLIPRPVSGRTSAVAVNPRNDRNWLIGAAQGGLWETPNAGATWIPRTDGEISQAIGAIAFAPGNPQTIYAGTGEGSLVAFCYSGQGVLKSTNGGATWTLLGQSSFAGNAITAIRVNPTNPDVVLATSTRGVMGRVFSFPTSPPRGLFKSTDGGVSWALKQEGFASDLEVAPTDFGRQYAGFGDSIALPSNGIYRSFDGGNTWSLVTGPWSLPPLSTRGAGRVEIAIAPSDPNVVYVSIQDTFDTPSQSTDGTLLGLFKSTNAWDPTPTWVQISMGTADNNTGFGHCGWDPIFGRVQFCWYAHDVIVDPTNANTIYAGGVALWKFDGASWTEVSQRSTNPPGAIHVDQQAFAWAGSRLIVGNDGGVWSTTDGGATWDNHNTNLSTVQFYDGAIHPTNPDFAIGGNQDNGMAKWAGRPEWTMFFGADGAAANFSSSQPDIHWAFSHQGLRVRRTRDAGATSIPATRGINFSSAPFIGRLEKCPANENVFLTGGRFLFRTNEFFTAPDAPPPGQVIGGPQWFFNGLTFPVGVSIEALAFFPGETTCTKYAVGGFDGRLRITLSGGPPWFILDSLNEVPNRPVTDIAFHPADPNVIYVTLSGFDEATPGQPGHLFRSTKALGGPAAEDWINIGPPVNVPFNTIAVDPANPNRLFLGTDVGVFVSTDGGATWAQFSPQSGLPNVAVYDIEINPVTNRVVAFTHGRGAFVYKTEAAHGN